MVRNSKTTFGLAEASSKARDVIKIEGSSSSSAIGTTHSFSEEEKLSFCDWINYTLKDDQDLQTHNLVPIAAEGMQLFEAVHNGIVMWYVPVDRCLCGAKRLGRVTFNHRKTSKCLTG